MSNYPREAELNRDRLPDLNHLLIETKKLSDRRLRRAYANFHYPQQENTDKNPGKLHLTSTTLSGKGHTPK